MRLHLTLIGTFRLTCDRGVDRTPRAAKARGLLALLGTARDHRRARRWLEARLWSDRSPEQASGSMRQALYEIRQALGPHGALLGASRDMIWLEETSTDIEADPAAAQRAIEAGGEFLEGLDLRDPGFDDWLVVERARFTPPERVAPRTRGAAAQRLPFLMQVDGRQGSPGAFLSTALSSEVARLISDLAEVEVYHLAPGKSDVVAPVKGLRLGIEAAQYGASVYLVATITNIAQRRVAWTRRLRLPQDPMAAMESSDFAQVAYEAAEAAHAALALAVEPDSETWAQGRQAQAVRAIFTFDREQLWRADRLLKESVDVMPTAQAWAWRAFLRQTLLMERQMTGFAEARAEAEGFAHKALAFPGRHSIVLALISQTSAMLAMDAGAAMATAREAVALNPLSPYAHYALAAAHLRGGQLAEARQHGHQAILISASSHNAFFFQGISALIALAEGDLETCRQVYAAIAVRAPQFRPPLRALTALSLARGEAAEAARYAAQLARVEPGFTLDTLLYDEGYPAVTMRMMGLLQAAHARR